VKRGQLWWAELHEPHGSEPGYRRPVLVIQADSFNASRIQTVIVVAITSNLRLKNAPGNVLLPARMSGLAKDSVANVSQILTLDKSFLSEQMSQINAQTMRHIDDGIKLALAL
jgi:mRNA interferase MazF